MSTIVGTEFNHDFFGPSEADEIPSGDGNDGVFGEEGDDVEAIDDGTVNDPPLRDVSDNTPTTVSAELSDTPLGPVAADELPNGDGDDDIVGAEGDDVDGIDNSTANAPLLGDASDDMPTIVGTEFGDYLFGTDAADEIFGGDGNDIIFGGDGDDVIHDGAGNDTLFGDSGDDTFIVFDNNGFAPSPVFDPFGMAAISGGDGYDTLDATTAVEAINFAEDNFEFASIEKFIGSSFDDQLSAALVSFDVVLSGQAGNDTLVGGSGHDRISGDAGADWLTGGLGSDVFEYASLNDSLLSGFDVIQDLAIASDFIEAPVPVAAADLQQLGAVAALEASAIAAVLSESVFGPSGAATFTFEEQRTFLAVNDGMPGFQAATDAIIEVTGYSGDLAELEIAALGTSEVVASALPMMPEVPHSDDLTATPAMLPPASPLSDAMLLL